MEYPIKYPPPPAASWLELFGQFDPVPLTKVTLEFFYGAHQHEPEEELSRVQSFDRYVRGGGPNEKDFGLVSQLVCCLEWVAYYLIGLERGRQIG